MKSFSLLLIALSIFTTTSCGLVTLRPKLEMRLAAEAFIAAKKANAGSLAPNRFRKAEFYYLKAKSSYRRKYFNKAKQYAIMSLKLSEEAEYVAVRKKTLGDS